MSVYEHPDVIEKGPQEIKDAAERVILLDAFTTDYTEATTAPATGKALADVAVASGDWTLAAATPDGRKITMTAKTGVPVDESGSGDHFAVVDDSTSRLLLVTETDDVYSVTAGQTATFKGWSYRRAAAVLV